MLLNKTLNYLYSYDKLQTLNYLYTAMIKLVSCSSQDWLKFNKHFNKCQKGLQVPFTCQVRKTLDLLAVLRI